MKIICDNCRTKYSIADEKVKGKVFKIRCKKCSNIIVVRGNQPQSPTYAEPQGASADFQARATVSDGEDPVWHLVIDQKQVGPMTASEVRDRFAQGEIDSETYIWREGFSDWQRINQVEDFSDIAQATAVAPTGAVAGGFAQGHAPAAELGGAEQQAPWGGDSGAMGDAPAAWDATAEQRGDSAWESPGGEGHPDTWSAADPAGGAQEGHELFGGGSQQGPGQDLFASHPHQDLGGGMPFGGRSEAAAPAAQPQGHGNLFGPAPAQGATSDLFGGQRPAEAGPQLFPSSDEEPNPAEAQLTGARNENSVLFSLTNLQALAMGGKAPAPSVASGPAPGPAPVAGTGDGSGLIDIRSMATTTAPSRGPSVGDALPDLGGFASPIAAAPVLIPAMGEEKPKWLLPTLIGGGALLLIAVVVLVVVLVTRKPESQVVVAAAPVGQQGQGAQTGQPATDKTDPQDAKKAATGTGKEEGADSKTGGDEDKTTDDTDKKPKKSTAKRRRSGKRRASKQSEEQGNNDILSPTASRSRSRKEPARKRDALDDLIDSAVGKKSSGRPRAAPRKRVESSAPDPNLPETLSRAEIQGGMRGIKGKVQGCYDRYKVPGLANVQVKIDRSGRVSSAQVKGMFAGTPTGACVQAAAKSARFSRFSGSPITITYPFILR